MDEPSTAYARENALVKETAKLYPLLELECEGRRAYCLGGHENDIDSINVLADDNVILISEWVLEHCLGLCDGTTHDKKEDWRLTLTMPWVVAYNDYHVPKTPLLQWCRDMCANMGIQDLRTGTQLLVFWWDMEHKTVDRTESRGRTWWPMSYSSKYNEFGIWYSARFLHYDPEEATIHVIYDYNEPDLLEVGRLILPLNYVHFDIAPPLHGGKAQVFPPPWKPYSPIQVKQEQDSPSPSVQIGLQVQGQTQQLVRQPKEPGRSSNRLLEQQGREEHMLSCRVIQQEQQPVRSKQQDPELTLSAKGSRQRHDLRRASGFTEAILQPSELNLVQQQQGVSDPRSLQQPLESREVKQQRAGSAGTASTEQGRLVKGNDLVDEHDVRTRSAKRLKVAGSMPSSTNSDWKEKIRVHGQQQQQQQQGGDDVKNSGKRCSPAMATAVPATTPTIGDNKSAAPGKAAILLQTKITVKQETPGAHQLIPLPPERAVGGSLFLNSKAAAATGEGGSGNDQELQSTATGIKANAAKTAPSTKVRTVAPTVKPDLPPAVQCGPQQVSNCAQQVPAKHQRQERRAATDPLQSHTAVAANAAVTSADRQPSDAQAGRRGDGGSAGDAWPDSRQIAAAVGAAETSGKQRQNATPQPRVYLGPTTRVHWPKSKARVQLCRTADLVRKPAMVPLPHPVCEAYVRAQMTGWSVKARDVDAPPHRPSQSTIRSGGNGSGADIHVQEETGPPIVVVNDVVPGEQLEIGAASGATSRAALSAAGPRGDPALKTADVPELMDSMAPAMGTGMPAAGPISAAINTYQQLTITAAPSPSKQSLVACFKSLRDAMARLGSVMGFISEPNQLSLNISRIRGAGDSGVAPSGGARAEDGRGTIITSGGVEVHDDSSDGVGKIKGRPAVCGGDRNTSNICSRTPTMESSATVRLEHVTPSPRSSGEGSDGAFAYIDSYQHKVIVPSQERMDAYEAFTLKAASS